MVPLRSTLLGAALLLAGCAALAAQQEKKDWQPAPPAPDTFDWIELQSDEWLKGRILVMYRESLQFHSEKLGDLTLDFSDVRQIRSAATMQVGLLGGSVVRGQLVIDGDKVLVVANRTMELERSQVLSITSGEPKERSYWSGKVGGGANFRRGNSEQLEANSRVSLERRTVKNRIGLNYLGNHNITEGVTVAANLRANVGWDRFISRRCFVRATQLEYYRDPFQNIAHRYVVGAGVGYQLVKTPKIEWHVSAGLGYQQIGFDDVAAGEADSASTGALVVASVLDHELSDSIHVKLGYKFYLVNERSGQYTHDLVSGFEFGLIRSLALDVTFVWDRIEKPRPTSDGTVPKQDDYRLNLALSIGF